MAFPPFYDFSEFRGISNFSKNFKILIFSKTKFFQKKRNFSFSAKTPNFDFSSKVGIPTFSENLRILNFLKNRKFLNSKIFKKIKNFKTQNFFKYKNFFYVIKIFFKTKFLLNKIFILSIFCYFRSGGGSDFGGSEIGGVRIRGGPNLGGVRIRGGPNLGGGSRIPTPSEKFSEIKKSKPPPIYWLSVRFHTTPPHKSATFFYKKGYFNRRKGQFWVGVLCPKMAENRDFWRFFDPIFRFFSKNPMPFGTPKTAEFEKNRPELCSVGRNVTEKLLAKVFRT